MRRIVKRIFEIAIWMTLTFGSLLISCFVAYWMLRLISRYWSVITALSTIAGLIAFERAVVAELVDFYKTMKHRKDKNRIIILDGYRNGTYYARGARA